MKKTKLVLTIALGGLLISTGALSTFAADHDGSGTTTGKVDFEEQGPGSKGPITKPGTPNVIIEVPGGNHTKGPLRLTFVPNFDFGTMEISSDTTWGNAKYLDFNKQNETTTAKISHFAQVEDVRGGTTDGWSLKVSADKFKGRDAANREHILDNSVVQFNEAKVFNTRIANVGDVVDFLTPSVTTVIPNDGAGSLALISTKAGQSTNSSKTSLVFNNDYTAEEAITEQAQIEKGNTGVQLKSIGDDNKVKGVTYVANLTWTLEAAP